MTSKYAQAGVDFEKEHSVVEVMTTVGKETAKNVKDLEEKGISFPEEGSDFSGGFKLNLETLVKNGIKEVVQSGGVDGPGSKPVVHQLYNGDDERKLAATAIDSIAMCTNDVICSGARPLVVLEYHSWNNVNLDVAKQMAKGKLVAAELSKAAIIGGENASLSAMITGPRPEKAYDMCNMALGIVIDQELIDNPLGKGRVKAGDYVIGLSSSGVHCNGITLGWKTAMNYSEKGYKDAWKINKKLKELNGESVAEALLTPTLIYVDPMMKVISEYGDAVKAVANITGEGIHNMRRVLPSETGLMLDYSEDGVQQPHLIFNWIQNKADVSSREMFEDYNMGTGMVVIVDRDSAPDVIKSLSNMGRKQKKQENFSAYRLGKVVADPNEMIEVITPTGRREMYGKER